MCDHVGAWEVYKLNKGTDKVVNDLYSDLDTYQQLINLFSSYLTEANEAIENNQLSHCVLDATQLPKSVGKMAQDALSCFFYVSIDFVPTMGSVQPIFRNDLHGVDAVSLQSVAIASRLYSLERHM